MRKLGWNPDASHRVTISEKEPGITVTDITLTKTTVVLGESFDAHVFVTNTTGETPWKALAAAFGVVDPSTGAFTPYFVFAGEVNIPIGDTEWVIECYGVLVGTWDTVGAVGYRSNSNFIPEHWFGYLDMLTVSLPI